MGAPQPGLVIFLSNEDPSTDAAPFDAPAPSIVEACAHYRAADARTPSYVTIYTVSDIEAIPAGDCSGDRKRVYRRLHDAAVGEPLPGNIKGGVILSTGGSHTAPEALVAWHAGALPQLRAVPGWVRAAGYELVRGAETVGFMLGLQEYESESSFGTEEFERYVGDSKRVEIIRDSSKNERRILLLYKTVV
ncbi:hypothetical protein EXIGLDRAFT_497222 [Exidia glandulosa HHB12029]|uniref:EthD domain-containing protein n=1 Tax=Exidia glandulosa HHB12029 TaxID=1314781 RepID=A0A165JI25_EXIGL|nr:hypothetical protein EXIGLDRAFT_497222 [Exidia glandulosa HHB12029]